MSGGGGYTVVDRYVHLAVLVAATASFIVALIALVVTRGNDPTAADIVDGLKPVLYELLGPQNRSGWTPSRLVDL